MTILVGIETMNYDDQNSQVVQMPKWSSLDGQAQDILSQILDQLTSDVMQAHYTVVGNGVTYQGTFDNCNVSFETLKHEVLTDLMQLHEMYSSLTKQLNYNLREFSLPFNVRQNGKQVAVSLNLPKNSYSYSTAWFDLNILIDNLITPSMAYAIAKILGLKVELPNGASNYWTNIADKYADTIFLASGNE